jgi:hypothetical protein
MNREYDIFERLPDASVRCLIRVHGTRHVPAVLEKRGQQTKNECFAMNIRTREIVARVNDQVARSANSSDTSAKNGTSKTLK